MEGNAAQATWESLKQGALDHYDYVSTKAHHWSSFVVAAIKAYDDPNKSAESPSKEHDPFLEWIDKESEAAQKRLDKADTEGAEIGAAITLNHLRLTKEKYLSLNPTSIKNDQ